MNRAILIVICDFLVSTMLSMMSGMVPAHTGGTGVGLDEATTKMLLANLSEREAELKKLRKNLRETMEKLGTTPEQEAELRRLAAELAADSLKREKLEQSLRATAKNTGKLSPEELQKRLDEEKKKRFALEIELQDQSKDLTRVRTVLTETGKLLTVNRDALAKTSASLAAVTRENAETNRQLTQTSRELAKTGAELESSRKDLNRTAQDLSHARSALQNIGARLDIAQGESKKLQTTLAFTTGQLRTRERDNAGLQDKLDRSERLRSVAELERHAAQIQREEMQKMLRSAVSELSKVRTQLAKESAAKTAAETRLADTAEMLRNTAHARNDVLNCYSKAVLFLKEIVAEERMLGSQRGGGNFYFPVVDFNGRRMIVGTLNKFAGDAEKALGFTQVTQVDFRTIAPVENAGEVRLAGPIRLLRGNKRAAAIDYPGNDRQALKLLTFAELQKRGLEGLYLFKCGSLGKESAELDKRCSLSAVPGECRMFIRNAGRANNELRAEPGDFVLTREGEFVGVVVEKESIGSGQVLGAGVQLFADGKAWEGGASVPIMKKPSEKYYSEFSAAMQKLRGEIPADSRRH